MVKKRRRKHFTDHPNKVTGIDDKKRLEIIKMLGEFCTAKQVQYEMKRKYNVDITESNIYGYKNSNRWHDQLLKFRKKYTEDVESIPGSHKRVRMERMERVYQKADEKDDLKNSITVTEHQRKEIEGDGNKHTGDNVLIQFNNMSDAELQAELANTIEYVKKLEIKKAKDVIDIKGANDATV